VGPYGRIVSLDHFGASAVALAAEDSIRAAQASEA
jgi:hypothetical protein